MEKGGIRQRDTWDMEKVIKLLFSFSSATVWRASK